MAKYALEDEAENDLLAIGRYTAARWSLEQAARYLSALEEHFEAICEGTAHVRQFLEHRTDLFLSHCQHHYVFFARDDDATVLILAIFHENMDLLARLHERLNGS